jgi:hypothetical protein
MNKPKFYYEGNVIVFFTMYQGTKVELLRAKLVDADFENIQRLRDIAQVNMNEMFQMMRLAA